MADWWYSPSRAARVVWFKCVFSVHCSRRGCLLNADEISKLGPRLIHARALCQCLKLHGAWGRHRVHHLEIIASDLQEKKKKARERERERERHTHTHTHTQRQVEKTKTETDRERVSCYQHSHTRPQTQSNTNENAASCNSLHTVFSIPLILSIPSS